MRLLLLSIIAFVASTSFACEHLSLGVPKHSDFVDCRIGYAVGYNFNLKSAEWVAYRLTDTAGDSVSRTEDFRSDPEIPAEFQTSPNDYEEPIYDQGHLANADSVGGSEESMSESFLLSNMVPQLKGHNRAIWKGLEGRERKWAKLRGEVFVFAGPAYLGSTSYIGDRVPVPSHFWKIIFDPQTNESIAFFIDHKDLLTSELDKFLRSIDEIEVLADLDFLSMLDFETETRVEALRQNDVWSTQ